MAGGQRPQPVLERIIMSTYTQPGSVWISEGGEVLCREHGGGYLTAAIDAGAGPHIFTPLDDWLYHSPQIAEQYNLRCEVCTRIATHNQTQGES